jgi:hypothetical protein
MLTVIHSSDILGVLDGVLRTLCRGLPQYLVEAKPWLQNDDASFLAALRNLIADQRHYASRVANAVAARGGRPEPGPFPLEYGSINDLSLDFLKKRILEQLREDYVALTRTAKQLTDQHELHALVEEIVGNYRGHLEVLEETE